MKYVASEVASSGEDMNGGNKKVDWNDFNYPVCLKVFHYTPEETPEVLRRTVSLLRVNHLLIIVACLLNFITNIVDTAQGYSLLS